MYQLITSLQSNPWHRPRSVPLSICRPEMLESCWPTSHYQLEHVVLMSKVPWCTMHLTENSVPPKRYQLIISHQSISWEGLDACAPIYNTSPLYCTMLDSYNFSQPINQICLGILASLPISGKPMLHTLSMYSWRGLLLGNTATFLVATAST